MPVLSNRQILQDDPWQILESDAELPQEGSHIAVSLAQLGDLDQIANLEAQGLIIDGDVELDDLIPHLDKVDLIGIWFTALRDGRGFSLARLLRAQGFKGELRALGEVSRDRLSFLERCGFDSVDLPEAMVQDGFLDAYTEISVTYQGCEDTPLAIYSRG